jgi:hypothetical protein
MPAYFQPQQSSLNKDASQQYGHEHNERELLAVVEALVPPTRGRTSYLEATDSMINATNIQPNQRNRRINRWIEVLQAYPPVWRYLPGQTNPADAPSHRPDYLRRVGLPRNITIACLGASMSSDIKTHVCDRPPRA